MIENDVMYKIMKNPIKISAKNYSSVVSKYENIQGFELTFCIESIYGYQIQRIIQNPVKYLR